MGGFYNAEQQGAFVHNMKDVARLFTHPGDFGREIAQTFKDYPLTGIFHLMGRAIQTTTEPLMGALVPRAKLGAFFKMAEDWMQQHPNASPEEHATAMIKAWDSVDNRLGQMVYDNLFWHKTLKDLAFISTRSVGWNLGTVRELGGAPLDAARAVTTMLKGQKPEMTHRMAYAMMLPVVVAPMGAILTYMMTGKGPQQALDYFFPPDGNGGRMSLPSYLKDVVEYAHNPLQTVANKAHPLLSMAQQVATNKDYYGYPIQATGESAIPAYLHYLTNQVMPFSIRSQQKGAAQGLPPWQQALAFWGIQQAPGFIAHPEKQQAYDQRHDIQMLKARERARAKGTIP